MNDSHDNAQTDREALERFTPETLTHAVTVPQPLAWALASGHCPVINSDTRPDMQHFGKLIGIHAGRRMVAAEGGGWWRAPVPGPSDLTCGALVGVARLVGVVRALPPGSGKQWRQQFNRMHGRSVGTLVPESVAELLRPWWRGPWGWLLEDAVELPEPIPMRGGPGVWWMGGHTGSEWALEQWRKGRATR